VKRGKRYERKILDAAKTVVGDWGGGGGSIHEREENNIKKERKKEKDGTQARVDEGERRQVCRRAETDAEEIYILNMKRSAGKMEETG